MYARLFRMTITLAVTPRDESTTTQSLRASGGVPAVIYGPKQEPTPVAIDSKVFDKVRKEAGESTIIEIAGLKEPVEVLIKDVDFNPVKQEVVHVDFYAIERGKDITTTVALEFIGEAPVEESRDGSVNKVLYEVMVTCRPSDLPSHIDVDLSSLVAVEDKILIQDLKIGEGITLEADPEDAVVVVSAAKQESEDEEEAAEVDMDAIEVEHKGKEEDEAEKSE